MAGLGHGGWGENKERTGCNQLNNAVQDTEMDPGHLPIILWANAVNPFPYFQASFFFFFKKIQINYKVVSKKEQIILENMRALGNIHNLDL